MRNIFKSNMEIPFAFVQDAQSDHISHKESIPCDEPTQGRISNKLDDNIKIFNTLFMDVDIMLSRRFSNKGGTGLDFCVFYSDGVVDSMMINEHLIEPILEADKLLPGPGLFDMVKNSVVATSDMKESNDIDEIVSSITYGDTLLLVEGSDRALIISSKRFTLRSVTEPEGEKVLSGPREGFTEGLMVNLSMLRRRLRTHDLKMKLHSAGSRTKTGICVCYMEGIVNKEILNELYRRLDSINIDGVLDGNYITEYIAERSFLGFPATGSTERPDTVAARLLEGRIAIIIDGSPMVLTLPYLFIENFQSNEDYYVNHYYATFSRVLRILGFFLTVLTPAVYIAIVAFHHEILPTALMISISAERQSVPLIASVEAFVMLIILDILRETGIRMPSHVGQALSIIGALVIGQAAVEAKLVASPMIIVVAFTGITNLLIPRLSAATLTTRYTLMLLASCFGLIGVVSGFSIFLIHIMNLSSYGVPAFIPMDKLKFQDVKDTFFRAPWPDMKTRLSPLSENTTRSGGSKS